MISDIVQCAALGAAISTLGMCGTASGRNNVTISSMSIESMPSAVNPNSSILPVCVDDVIGQLSALLVLTVAAAEPAIGLAILVIYSRIRGTISVQFINSVKG